MGLDDDPLPPAGPDKFTRRKPLHNAHGLVT